MESELMPSAFVGHGNPMNALEHNRYTRAWREFGASIPTPRAIVVISAHWYVGSTLVTGAPDVAAEIAEVVKPRWGGLDEDGWGLDHGTWSVLVHIVPEANIPVVQLSVNGFEGYDDHFELGVRLAPLRKEGILILGSGNVVHNLGLIDLGAGEGAFDWAVRFSETCTASMVEDPQRTGALVDHPDYGLAAPTPDHFLPLAPVAGLAAAAGTPAHVLVDGYVGGSLSMTSFRVG